MPWTLCALQDLRGSLELALELTGIKKGKIWGVFWAAHQLFFKLLAMSLKLRGASSTCWRTRAL